MIHLKHDDKRNDYRTFPFYKLWEEAKSAIWGDQETIAESKMLQLYRELAISPDLTRTHRHDLIRVFKADFEQEKDFRHEARTPASPKKVFKGGPETLNPQARIEKLRYLAGKIGAPALMIKSLQDLNTHWDTLVRKGDVDLTDDTLNEQLRAIASKSKTKKPDPMALADLLTAASLASAQGTG